GVAHEQLLVGEAVAHSDELIHRHIERPQDRVERLAEIAPWEFAVMTLHQLDPVLPGDAAAADVQAGDIGGAPEAELQELEVVVYAGLMVVEVLVVDDRALDRLLVGGETVRL